MEVSTYGGIKNADKVDPGQSSFLPTLKGHENPSGIDVNLPTEVLIFFWGGSHSAKQIRKATFCADVKGASVLLSLWQILVVRSQVLMYRCLLNHLTDNDYSFTQQRPFF